MTRRSRVVRGFGVDAPQTVAVVAGGDAQRALAARDAGRDAASALSRLGHRPVLVEAGSTLAGDLLESGATVALIAALDDRLADGSLQDICGVIGIECLGAPATVARACCKKAVAAARMAEFGAPVPAQYVFTREATVAAGVGAVLPIAVQLGGDEVFIKPGRGSGGIGVKRVPAEHAADAVSSAFNYDNEVIVERAIVGTELTVLMTGGSPDPFAVGVAEVTTTSTDPHAAVWARRWAPADHVDPNVLRAAVAAARRAAWALNLAGLTTVDVVVDGSQAAWVIDVNAMIDWRADRAVPACLASSDLSDAQLIASLFDDLAVRRRLAA